MSRPRVQARSDVSEALSDRELIALFDREPDRAWGLFIDKHADRIFTTLRRLGFDYDEAMDRFVYVCEKLTEGDYRRLRGVRHLGRDGEITPWLVQVVRNLSINWAVSRHGRRRLLKPIAELPDLDQDVFTSYFWQDLRPSEVWERLRSERRLEVTLADVLDSLDRIFERLSATKTWRLVGNLLRRRPSGSLFSEDAEERLAGREPTPEQAVLRSEAARHLAVALEELPAQERLLVVLRYEEGLPLRDAARHLGLDEPVARAALRRAQRRLKRRIQEQERPGPDTESNPEKGILRVSLQDKMSVGEE